MATIPGKTLAPHDTDFSGTIERHGDDALGGAGTMSATAMKMGTMTMAKTVSSKKVVVKGGMLLSVPFKTSEKPFVRSYPSGAAFGLHDTIKNPPNKDRTTTARATYNKTAVTVQSAGTVTKRKVPYHPEAPRNRVKNDQKRLPPPFSSTLSFETGVINKSLHPFRTMSGVTGAPTKIPMHERLGFTNEYITSELTKRLHKPMYS